MKRHGDHRSVQVMCIQCGTEFEHDANFEDAYCPECGEMTEVHLGN